MTSPGPIGLTFASFMNLGLEQAVTAAARAEGVTVAPIGRFCISPVATRGVVMGFSGVRPPEIVQGVRTLARAIEGIVA